jgi:hypothetical protein
MEIESTNTKTLRDVFVASVLEPSPALKIEEKKVAERAEIV